MSDPRPGLLGSPADEADPDGGPGLTAIRQTVTSLDRAARTWRLYDGRGSTLETQLEDLVRRSTALVESGSVSCRVRPFGLSWQGSPLQAPGQSGASWLELFREGVRELTLHPGLEAWELRALLDVLCSEPQEGDDRVTALWRREVRHVELYVASVLSPELEVDENGEVRLIEDRSRAALLAASQSETAPELAFSPDDIRRLRADDRLAWIAEAQAPPYEPAAWIVEARDSASEKSSGEHFRGFVQALLSVRPGLGGEDGGALPALLESALQTTFRADRGGAFADQLRFLCEHDGPEGAHFRASLASEAWMTRLAQACDETPELFEASIAAIGREAPDALTGMLVDLRSPEARSIYARLAGEAGGNILPFYEQQLSSEDESEALAAVAALGTVDGADATTALAVAVAHPLEKIRYRALRALGGRYHPAIRSSVLAALRDPRRVNRLLALGLLEGSSEEATARAILAELKSPGFMERDKEEQGTWLAAVERFDEPGLLSWLDEVLDRNSMVRGRTLEQLQLQVVASLARRATDRSRRSLEKASKRWALTRGVRKAAAAALKEGSG